jgi:hypothetical protein
MGTGYTRNDTSNNIADGNIINAADLDGEFDAIESAMGTSGHTHDGTSAEGGPVTVLGPVQDFVASATEIKPKTTNTLDIGTSGLLFKDMFLDGVATVGSIKIDNAGTIGSASDADAIAISSGGVVSFSQNTIGKTGSGYVLSLQTSDTTIEATNVLGKIEFSAPDEASGTDAILVGASIEALAEDTFDSSTNSTALVFKTNTTGAATERMRLTSAGDLHFLDNRKAIFGAGSDLWIYHDGTDSYIEERNGTGSLYIDATDLQLRSTANAKYFRGITGGAVDLYYDNASKLATTSTGISVTGNATFADNGKAIFGAGSDLQIYHNSANNKSYIEESGSGNLVIRGSDIDILAGNGEAAINVAQDGAVTLYYDNAEKLATTNTGVDITGTLTSDGLTVDGSSSGTLNNVNFLNTNSGATTTANRIGLGITNSGGAAYTYIEANEGGIDSFPHLNFYTGSSATKRLEIADNGDISFYEDTGTTPKFFWDASAESLGIGNTNPDAIIRADSGTANKILFKHNPPSNRYFSIAESSDGTYDNAITTFYKDATVGQFVFETAAAERMRIDSSGNLLVGTTNTDPIGNSVAGMRIGSTGFFNINAASAASGFFGRSGSDGEIVKFYKDGALVGSIGVSNSNVTIGNGGAGIKFTGSINVLEPWTPSSNSASDGAIDIGYSGGRFKDLYLSGTAYVDTAVEIHAGNSLKLQNVAGNGFATIQNAGAGTNTDLSFNTAGSEAMRIDSSGNLLVGVTSTTIPGIGNTTNGVSIRSGGNNSIAVSRDGDVAGYFNRNTSDGDIVEFRKDGSTVGSIGTLNASEFGISSSNDLVLTQNTTTQRNLLFRDSFFGPFGSDNGALDLGRSGGKFRDLYLSGGVYLGGTGSANKLDDYEEGTFAPTVSTGTVATTTATYTKIGQLVTVRGLLHVFSDRTSTDYVEVTNLPFLTKSASNEGANGSIFGRYCGIQLSSTYILSNSNSCYFYNTNPTGNYEPLQYSDLSDSSAAIYFMVTYETSQ